ncbi:MAG: tetratricopeptide repeat protein [Nitrospinota bacterium]|nr:tetratricopeptide repeat protein [Nitrospinota bacterium]
MDSPLLKNHIVAVLILVGIGVSAYAATLQSPFLDSEVRTLLEDPAIQDFSKVNEITRIDQIFNGSLPKLSFAINYLMGHSNPWGYHLVNLMIHLAVGLAFYWVVREWLIFFDRKSPAYLNGVPLVAAAIHLLHPLNSQAVILISSRSILFASLFYMLTFGFLARFLREFRENPKKAKGSIDLLMVMACFAVGGTSDPMMVTLPFMGWIFSRFYMASTRKVEGEIFALTLIPWIIYLIYQITTPAAELVAEFSGKSGSLAAVYFLTQIKAFVFYYLPKALFPLHLNLDPDFRLVSGLTDWTWMLALVAIGALFALARATRSSLVQWSCLWTFLIFVSFYAFAMDAPTVSEPRFYLPGMGIHLLLAMGLVELGIRHPIAGWLRIGVPVLFMILTFSRGQDYRTEISLWQATAQSSPHKSQVHYELGKAYLSGGMTDQAEKELVTTLELNAKHIPALIKMGELQIQRKEYAKALESYLELIRQNIKPPVVNFNAGLALLEMGKPEDAVPYLEEAVGKQPGVAAWHLSLARAYHKSSQLQKALKHYRASTAINPDQPVAHNEMGMLFWDLKSFYFADAAFQEAYQLDNRYVGALNNLATSSMMFKQYDQAIGYLDRLLEINPEDDNAYQLRIAAQRFQKQQKSQPPPPPKLQDFH